MTTTLGRFGIWTSTLGDQRPGAIRDAAAMLEQQGFGALWLPESAWTDPFLIATHALEATSSLVAATGVANIHGRSPRMMLNAADALGGWYPERFVLGLGVSHEASVVRMLGGDYPPPLASMRRYLDGIEAIDAPATRPEIVLAALGPKMTELAGTRTRGAHLYNVPVAHTALSRKVLGDGPLLVPEQKVVFERDPESARTLARRNLPLRLPNYANALVRVGFDPDAVARVDDEVVDAIVAWGDEDAIAGRLQEQLAAGADHVAVQVLRDEPGPPTDEWQRLAALLPT